jgi:hypothetical protein
MVTTRAGHAKKILGAELDDDEPQQPDTSRSVTKVLSLLTRQENSDSAWVQGKSTGLVTQSPRNRQNNKETQFKRRNTMKC